MELILGSQSPRRKEILGYFSVPFRQVSSQFDEEKVPFEGNPTKYAHTLSKGKADDLFLKFPDQPILTADTIVYCHGKVYNKPKDEQEAFRFLRELSGNWHSVFTSMTLRYKNDLWQEIVETKVLFHPLTDDQIHTYYRTLHYGDKAGGYMIQQAGGIIVAKIDGCYYNVMGFPINALRNLLLHLNIDLWDHLK